MVLKKILPPIGTQSLVSFLHLNLIQVQNILLQLFLIPFLLRTIGLGSFGLVSLSFAIFHFLSVWINYGSNQSGVKDVALAVDDPHVLSQHFFTIFQSRLGLFLLSLVLVPLCFYLLPQGQGIYVWGIYAYLLSELLNPFFFFVGLQKLFWYNLGQGLAKLLALGMVLWLVRTAADGYWVNLLLGLWQALFNLGLVLYAIRKWTLAYPGWDFSRMKAFGKTNFYLTANNASAQLQQSVFLFALSTTKNPHLLGAYALCDKFVWSFKILVISIFNVVYPKGAQQFQVHPKSWKLYKAKVQQWIVLGFALVGLVLFFGANWLVVLVTGKEDLLSQYFLQSVSLLPLVSALNALHIADLLLQNFYGLLFRVSMVLMGIALVLSWAMVQWAPEQGFGFFPLITEVCALALYTYFLQKRRLPHT